MPMKKLRPWLLAVLVLVIAVLVSSTVSVQNNSINTPVSSLDPSYNETESSSVISEESSAPVSSIAEVVSVDTEEQEMIGVWIPYMTLATTEKTQDAFCAKFDSIVADAAEMGFNTLFVHVRPFGDALYPSAYYPWSHILTGEQGKDPGFDPLAYMVEQAHAVGLELHAWVNPLRVSLHSVPASFSAENPYLAWQADERKDMFLRYENGICYDPGYGEVRDYITAGVAEIVENYDVDGIHFDDYFYPQNAPDADEQSYALYLDSVGENAVPLTKEEWRTANINALVSQVYAAVKAADPNVVFGISPSGVVKNNAALSADVTSWCAIPGYVDYICPQLYYSLENCPVTFTEALAAWNELPRAESIKLYIGLAVYKAGTEADTGAWLGRDDILAQEIVLGREGGMAGFVFYAWDQLQTEAAAVEVQNALAVLA